MKKVNESEVIGKTFNFLTILNFDRIHGLDKQQMAICKCVCGSVVRVTFGKLSSGHTKSCGCYRIKLTIERSTKHGMSHHRLVNVHRNMLDRCYNPKSKSYKDYGGRGIAVCPEWMRDKNSFFTWAINNGWESGLFVDRMDNNKGYGPENCQFVTRLTNNRNKRSNKRITYNGETRVLSEWCEHLNLNYGTVSSRLRVHKMSVNEAFSPVNYSVSKRRTKAHSDTPSHGSDISPI